MGAPEATAWGAGASARGVGVSAALASGTAVTAFTGTGVGVAGGGGGRAGWVVAGAVSAAVLSPPGSTGTTTGVARFWSRGGGGRASSPLGIGMTGGVGWSAHESGAMNRQIAKKKNFSKGASQIKYPPYRGKLYPPPLDLSLCAQ